MIARRFPRAAGFTLVELMVALALAAMISVAIMVISNQAREVYEVTTRKVEVYNKFRFALFSVERDFARWIPTSNLEYFADGRGSGSRRNENWDPGEEFPDTSDEHGPGVVDGGTYKDFDEFAYVLERHYVGEEPDGSKKIHDAYQAYFRTMTFIEGRVREANVEYMLLDPNRPDSHGNPQPPTQVSHDRMRDLSLYKVVRFHDISYDDIQKPSQNFPIVRRYVEVCTNITDFRIEYTTENRFDPRVNAAMRTPREDFETPAEKATAPARIDDPLVGAIFKKTFGYGSFKLQVNYPKATGYRAVFGDRQATRTDHRPVRFGWEQNPDIRFAELTPGDEIYIFNQSNRGGAAGNVPVAGNVGSVVQFPAGTYTVKTNVGGRLELREDVDSIAWPRDVTGVYYKAAFVPQSVRITLRVVDESRGEEPKTLQRVVWVRQKAR